MAALAGWLILELAPIWLMGVGTYRLTGRGGPSAAAWSGWIASIGVIAVLLLFKYSLFNRSGCICPSRRAERRWPMRWSRNTPWLSRSTNILAFDRIADHFRGWQGALAPGVRFLFGRSFSLYLYQAPLMFVLAAIGHRIESVPLQQLLLYGGTLGCAFLLRRSRSASGITSRTGCGPWGPECHGGAPPAAR